MYVLLNISVYNTEVSLGTVNLIFLGGGGGGAWVFFEKSFLALILANQIILLNGTVKKIICLQ